MGEGQGKGEGLKGKNKTKKKREGEKQVGGKGKRWGRGTSQAKRIGNKRSLSTGTHGCSSRIGHDGQIGQREKREGEVPEEGG